MNYLLIKSNFIIRRFSHHYSNDFYKTFNIELLYIKLKDNNLKLIEFENKLNEVIIKLEKVTKEFNKTK
jgi:uncharacterized protein YhbP (UPF0306 family)